MIDAGSGTEALARLEERPDVALMFTDCRMPGMTGPELAEAAGRRWPQLKIVLTTGYCDVEVSAWPLVPKPYDTLAIKRIFAELSDRVIDANDQQSGQKATDLGKR